MKPAKIILIAFILIALFSSENYPKDNRQKIKKEVKKENAQQESIIRKGVINLDIIDKNKDGKVYQDQMDWNVISDKPGKCPLCKMVLKEVTLKEAKANLKENGFKVK